MFETTGPLPVSTAREPDAFWSTLEDYYRRLMVALAA
jgi:hypothetical protein